MLQLRWCDQCICLRRICFEDWLEDPKCDIFRQNLEPGASVQNLYVSVLPSQNLGYPVAVLAVVFVALLVGAYTCPFPRDA